MCGIAGIVSKQGLNPNDLFRMSALLKHRGPDDEGYLLTDGTNIHHYRGEDTISQLQKFPHINEAKKNNSIGLMHRRLSIIDVSEGGHQPMERKQASVAFNGEIYNYKELREVLHKEGHVFKTESDTEVLLASWQKWGANCVEHFVGMWAFALLDHSKNTLFLSRDRFGIKPLYYFQSHSIFTFASEIKALLALDEVESAIDLRSALEFISFGATADPEMNLFANIKTLPPGHNATLDLQTLDLTTQKYYSIEEKVNNYNFSSTDKLASFRDLFDNSINMHLRSDVTVGSTLSGGLDSSTVVAWAARKMEGKKFKTFTASYNEPGIDESSYARKVTDALPNTEAHYAWPDIKNYWNDFEKMTWHQDLPISSTSMFAQWEVMKLAKAENTKVLLDGQGADEILGGYYNFAGIHLLELAKRGQLRSFFLEKQLLKTNFAPNINTALGRAFFYYLPEPVQKAVRARKRLGMGLINRKYEAALQQIRVPDRGGRTFVQQSYLSMRFGLQDLLRYEDRNSMAFSIESRVPFLDHRLVEFCLALRNDWKIRGGWTKYILRKTAEPVLDSSVVWRKDKMGFLTPQKSWMQASAKELTGFIGDVPAPEFMNKEHLLDIVKGGLTDSTHLSEFWRAVSFLKWWDVFKVKIKNG